MRAVLWRVALYTFLLRLCEAVSLNCTTTSKDKLMIYSIKSFPQDANMSNCEYSWISNDTVFASEKQNLLSVESKSVDTLKTKECFTNIEHKSHCESKTSGRLTNFEANCIASCSKKDHITENNVRGPLVPVGTIAAILAGLVGLGMAVGGYFLYKSRKKNQSDLTCGCTQCGGLYMSVNVPNPDLPARCVGDF